MSHFLYLIFFPGAVGVFLAQSKDRKVIQGFTVSISVLPFFFASLLFKSSSIYTLHTSQAHQLSSYDLLLHVSLFMIHWKKATICR